MIEITQDIDVQNLTVTWRLKDLGPEHEIDGKVCHAVAADGSAYMSAVGHVLHSLGYRYVCTVERPGPSWDSTPRRTEYWERPE